MAGPVRLRCGELVRILSFSQYSDEEVSARGQQRVTRHHQQQQQGVILCDFMTLQFVLALSLWRRCCTTIVIGHQLAAMLMLLKCEAWSRGQPRPLPRASLVTYH